MIINKYKNYIGLCAHKGCFKPFKVKIELAAEKDGVKVINKRFWLCHDCTWKLFKPDLTEED